MYHILNDRIRNPRKLLSLGHSSIGLTLLKTSKSFLISLDSIPLCGSHSVFINRYEPGIFMELALLVLYRNFSKQLQRLGFWFYPETYPMVRFQFNLYECHDRMRLALYAGNDSLTVLQPETDCLPEHNFHLNTETDSYRLKLTTTVDSIDIPVTFKHLQIL